MDVVMFGFGDWQAWSEGGFRTRCGALARAFAEHDDVRRLLVVSTARSVWVDAARRLRRGPARDPRVTVSPYRPHAVAEGVYALDHLRLLPKEEAYPLAYRVNGALHDAALRAAIASACARLDMRDIVLWVANPLMAKHIGRVGEAVSVFDAIDDWTRHPQKRRVAACARAGYERVRDRADLVLTVSKGLADSFGGRPGVYWQPNGVDAERFARGGAMPEVLRALPRPLLGYVGVLQERVDVGLLARVAAAMPEASIVMVGPLVAPAHFEPLRSLPNVHFIGERPAAEMPAYVSAFDVCLVPHVDSGFTRSMNPLKVYEYLAAGKPVVAAGLADMGLPDGLLSLAAEPQAFCAAVGEAVREGDSRIAERQAYARSQSWDRRVRRVLELIESSRGRTPRAEAIA